MGSYHTYSIPGKTAALVPEFAVEDLPLAELQPRFLSLQWKTCPWAKHWWWWIIIIIFIIVINIIIIIFITSVFYVLLKISTCPISCILPEKKVSHPQGLCSLAPGYNMCTLRDCSVTDWFVTVIGDHVALRRPIFHPVLTLQAVTVVLWGVKSVCNIHSRVLPCPADEYVLLLNNFSHFNRVVL